MRFVWAIFLLAAISQAADNGSSSHLAVLDLGADAGVDSAQIRTISDRLESELISTGSFKILERRRIQEILTEQGFQQTGACDASNCQVQMGQLLGVDQLVTGSVGRVGDVFTLNTKLISVSTGEIIRSEVVDVRGNISDLLTQGCRSAARGLAGKSDEKPVTNNSKGSYWLIGGTVAAVAVLGGGAYWIWGRDKSEKTVVVPATRSIE